MVNVLRRETIKILAIHDSNRIVIASKINALSHFVDRRTTGDSSK